MYLILSGVLRLIKVRAGLRGIGALMLSGLVTFVFVTGGIAETCHDSLVPASGSFRSFRPHRSIHNMNGTYNMASQLIKVTNSYSGEVTYLVQDKIEYFYANTKGVNSSWKKEVLTWVALSSKDELFPCYESVEYFLAKFPPL